MKSTDWMAEVLWNKVSGDIRSRGAIPKGGIKLKKNKIIITLNILVFLLNTFVLLRCIGNADFSETFWTTLVIEIVLSKWLISMLDSTEDRNKGISVWNIINLVLDAAALIILVIGYQSLSFIWCMLIAIMIIFDIVFWISAIRNHN